MLCLQLISPALKMALSLDAWRKFGVHSGYSSGNIQANPALLKCLYLAFFISLEYGPIHVLEWRCQNVSSKTEVVMNE